MVFTKQEIADLLQQKEFIEVDNDGKQMLADFRARFAPNELIALGGMDLLKRMFMNPVNNMDNLSYWLEKKTLSYFGAIGGSPECFGLCCVKSSKDPDPVEKWRVGTREAVAQPLSDQDAIAKGVDIRDKLVKGAKLIEQAMPLTSLSERIALVEQLYHDLGDFATKQWVIKYYALMYPEVFACYYGDNWQKAVMQSVGLSSVASGNLYDRLTRSTEIAAYVQECGVSMQVFHKKVAPAAAKLLGKDPESKKNGKAGNTAPQSTTGSSGNNKKIPLNQILYGAPGTGKTYIAPIKALEITEGKTISDDPKDRPQVMSLFQQRVASGQIEFVTFHQNYGYEDFIEGIKPVMGRGVLSFTREDGVFKVIADRARKPENQDQNYVIIIDEINRANISKVFGELITLIEEDKREGNLNAIPVQLPISKKPFLVPKNLYIIGTMNTADKSIALVDVALRRRFSFVENAPKASLVNADMQAIFQAINDKLKTDLQSTDLLIGHAIFMVPDPQNGTDTASLQNLADIMNEKVIPLLYEYYHESEKDVEAVVDMVVNMSNGVIRRVNSNPYARITVQ